MTNEGIFHDAHEVYLTADGQPRTWIATFSQKGYAEGYIGMVDAQSATFGVYPEESDKWEVVPV